MDSKVLDKLALGARILLGLVFVVFGFNYFVPFMKVPPAPANAMAFMGALFKTGYMFPFIKGTEIIAGALILSGRFAPLGLVILAPITLNILAYHLFLAGGAAMSVVLVALQGFLAWHYRSSFYGVLGLKAQD